MVNATQNYNFYVIEDTGMQLTMIMDRNLGDNVAWYMDEDNNGYGPVTALNALNERTSSWINIPEHTYRVSGLGEDEATRKYEDIEYIGRARLITYAEAQALGCTTSSTSCFEWMYTNLNGTGDNNTNGYWTSTAYSSSRTWYVSFHGRFDNYTVSNTFRGIRPVITISK